MAIPLVNFAMLITASLLLFAVTGIAGNALSKNSDDRRAARLKEAVRRPLHRRAKC
jgi:hypothetical protein